LLLNYKTVLYKELKKHLVGRNAVHFSKVIHNVLPHFLNINITGNETITVNRNMPVFSPHSKCGKKVWQKIFPSTTGLVIRNIPIRIKQEKGP
jgi:hypothetical protein